MSDQATITTAPAGTVAAPTTQSWRTEDWIAVVLGFLVITTVLVLFQWKVFDLRNVVPNFRWTTDSQIASQTPGWVAALDQIERDAQARQQQNVVALSKSLRGALAGQDRKAIAAAAAKMAALGPRTIAGALATEIRGHAAATPESVFAPDNLTKVLYVGIGFLIVTAIGVALVGWRVTPFLIGLPAIFLLAWSRAFSRGQRRVPRTGASNT